MRILEAWFGSNKNIAYKSRLKGDPIVAEGNARATPNPEIKFAFQVATVGLNTGL